MEIPDLPKSVIEIVRKHKGRLALSYETYDEPEGDGRDSFAMLYVEIIDNSYGSEEETSALFTELGTCSEATNKFDGSEAYFVADTQDDLNMKAFDAWCRAMKAKYPDVVEYN